MSLYSTRACYRGDDCGISARDALLGSSLARRKGETMSALDEQIGGICWPCTCCNRCGRMTDKFKCPICQTELEKTATVCPNCGAPLEILSMLDAYQANNSAEGGRSYQASSAGYSYAQPQRRKRRLWIIPLVIFLILAGLYALGRHELKKQEQEALQWQQGQETPVESFQMEQDTGEDLGDIVYLASAGKNIIA